MRFAGPSRFWLASCLLSLASTQRAWSFVPNLPPARTVVGPRTNTILSQLQAESIEKTENCECESPEDSDHAVATTPSLVHQKGSAEMFRSALLTDVDGNIVRLGDKMGDGSYAKEWSKLQRKIERSGAVGPLFVSIGDETKLKKFLQLNRSVPRNQAFVDDYSFRAYESVGLKSMELGQETPDDFTMSPPDLGGPRAWWKYMTSVMELSPVEPGSKEFPEGVKKLGGTFVIDGDDVVYEWNDRIPGDTPDLEDVMMEVVTSDN